MKKSKFLVWALAGASLALGACSSDDVVEGVGNMPGWNAEGNGYVTLAINLPQQPRVARANDIFDDGDPTEYAVNNATLILFAGSDEASAKVCGFYPMALNAAFENPGNDQITSVAKITQKIKQVTTTGNDKIYALVVLNQNEVLNSIKEQDLIGKTLNQVNEEIAKVAVTDVAQPWNTNGYLMSNVVLANKPGGANYDGTASTLVEIHKDMIQPTKTLAEMKPAANIFVERAQAKVTLKADNGSTKGDVVVGQAAPQQLAYTIAGWQLDNVNNASNLVRNVGSFSWKGLVSEGLANNQSSNYRFVGTNEVGKSIATPTNPATSFYRVYWGEDVNYSANTGLVTIGGDNVKADKLIKADGNAAGYCFENTVDFVNMTEANCTRVIVAADFNGGKDFWTIDDNRGEVFTSVDEVKAKVAERLFPSVKAWLNANIAPVNPGEKPNVIETKDFIVILAQVENGVQKVESVALTEAAKAKLTADGQKSYAAEVAKWAGIVNGNIRIDLYKGGRSYYSQWIKHFGDDLTPWTWDGQNPSPSSEDIYPGKNDDANYLGRYGVLRNNWYQIAVTGIKGIGSSTVDAVTGTKIDKKDSYISVKINVLSWAVRKQQVEL